MFLDDFDRYSEENELMKSAKNKLNKKGSVLSVMTKVSPPNKRSSSKMS